MNERCCEGIPRRRSLSICSFVVPLWPNVSLADSVTCYQRLGYNGYKFSTGQVGFAIFSSCRIRVSGRGTGQTSVYRRPISEIGFRPDIVLCAVSGETAVFDATGVMD